MIWNCKYYKIQKISFFVLITTLETLSSFTLYLRTKQKASDIIFQSKIRLYRAQSKKFFCSLKYLHPIGAPWRKWGWLDQEIGAIREIRNINLGAAILAKWRKCKIALMHNISVMCGLTLVYNYIRWINHNKVIVLSCHALHLS